MARTDDPADSTWTSPTPRGRPSPPHAAHRRDSPGRRVWCPTNAAHHPPAAVGTNVSRAMTAAAARARAQLAASPTTPGLSRPGVEWRLAADRFSHDLPTAVPEWGESRLSASETTGRFWS